MQILYVLFCFVGLYFAPLCESTNHSNHTCPISGEDLKTAQTCIQSMINRFKGPIESILNPEQYEDKLQSLGEYPYSQHIDNFFKQLADKLKEFFKGQAEWFTKDPLAIAIKGDVELTFCHSSQAKFSPVTLTENNLPSLMLCHNVPKLESKHLGEHLCTELINTLFPHWGFILFPDSSNKVAGIRMYFPYSVCPVSNVHFLEQNIPISQAIIFSALANEIAQIICSKYNKYPWFNRSADIDPEDIGTYHNRLQDNPLFDFPWDGIISALFPKCIVAESKKRLPVRIVEDVFRLFGSSRNRSFLIASRYIWPVIEDNTQDENYIGRKIQLLKLKPPEWVKAL